MPEHAEVRIVSEFINAHSKDRKFKKLYHVERGNNPIDSNIIEDFRMCADSNGKELILTLENSQNKLKMSVFLGMTGNWKLVTTDNWNETKFIRMRIDREDNYSLILYGYYMGPKYRLNGFTGVKRGPDPVKDFENFKLNIINNISNKAFTKPVAEVILNQQYFNGVGAYLTAEILGRLDLNPNEQFNRLSSEEIINLINMVKYCCEESYNYGGGELLDWDNPFGSSLIDDWIKYYGNKQECIKSKFGTRNIWILKKWKSSNDNHRQE